MLIRKSVLEGMIDSARRAAPVECCGLLVGNEGVIRKQIECANLRCSTTEFSIAPEELIGHLKAIRESSLDLLGIYHSHPASDPVPSGKDVAEFHYPGVTCWIISLQNEQPVVRCFEWKEDYFRRLSFQLLSEPGRR